MSIINDWASIESDSMAEYELYDSSLYEDEVDDWGYVEEEGGGGYTTPEYDPSVVGEFTGWDDGGYYDEEGTYYELSQEQLDAVDADLEALMMPEEGQEDLYAFTVDEEEEDEDSWWASLLGNKDLMNLLLAGGMGALDAFGKTKTALPTRSSGGGGGGPAPTTALAGQSGVVTRSA